MAVPLAHAHAADPSDSAAQASAGAGDALSDIEGKGRVIIDGVRQERFFGVDFLGDQGIVVGSFGQVMTSTDGGETWEEEKAPTDLALLGVALHDGGAIAVGQKGLVFLRDNDGQWQEVALETEERLLNVAANRDGKAVIVGAFGTVLASMDAGQSWTNVAPNWLDLAASSGVPKDGTGATAEPSMYDAKVFDDGVMLIAGELSYVLRSADNGASWNFVNYADSSADGAEAVAATAPTINDLHIRSDGTGFAVGQSGAVFKTTDRGRSWSITPTPLTEINLLAVASRGTGDVIAVGMRSAISSKDDGETWQSLEALDLDINWYSGIRVAPDGEEMVAVGHSGRIIALQ